MTVRAYVWSVRPLTDGVKTNGALYKMSSCIVSDEQGDVMVVTFWDDAAEYYNKSIKVLRSY